MIFLNLTYKPMIESTELDSQLNKTTNLDLGIFWMQQRPYCMSGFNLTSQLQTSQFLTPPLNYRNLTHLFSPTQNSKALVISPAKFGIAILINSSI